MTRPDTIKSAIRSCTTIHAVNELVKEIAPEIAAMDRQGGEARTMAIQIRNLAGWKRMELGRDPENLDPMGPQNGPVTQAKT